MLFWGKGGSGHHWYADSPKGCRGERREARAQWAQPPKAVSDPEFRQTTSGAHGSAGRADCLLTVFFAECGPKGVQGASGKPPALLH